MGPEKAIFGPFFSTLRITEKLTVDGGQEVQCGWLKDKFGLSWQAVPTAFQEIMSGTDKEGTKRAMNAMFKMKRFDIATLKQAYQG